MARGMRSETFHAAVALALTLTLTLVLMLLFHLEMRWERLLICWLAAINVVAFAYYGYDKLRAKVSRSRVPEMVLYGIALAGGTLGAYIGMQVFRHKTIKGSFRLVFWVIAVLQGLLILAALYRLSKSS
jgi:uncharacterized membrane protein YsdA (DUF1294 family)